MTDPGEITPRRAGELGMNRPISRRDFFDGVATAAGVAALETFTGRPASAEPMGTAPRGSHPAALTGLRGDAPEDVGVPHALRDGRFWAHAGPAEPTGERYDLVVVGAGISGISAAHRWLEHDPDARILILDNHDDVGGHARRNEFHPTGRRGPLVGYGGSQAIEAPSAWTPEGRRLLDLLGVRPARLAAVPYPGLGSREGVFCDRESFGVDRLVRTGTGARRWISELPLAERARRDLLTLHLDPPDWLRGLTEQAKHRFLAGLTYSGFLGEVCGVHPDVLRFVRTMPSDEWGYGSDAFGAVDAWGCGYPGFQGLGLDRSKPSVYNSPSVIRHWEAPREVLLFPEGNQALVRMMVGRMVPGFATSVDPEDVTTARFDYDRLDRPGGRVRVRLSSPVVSVANDGDPETATTATVGYFDGDRVRTVRAAGVIMACWNMMIPHLVTGLPPEQERALRAAVKVPMLYATVQLRDWRAWQAIGVGRVRFTGAYWSVAELAPRVAVGGYRPPGDPGEPVLAHLVRAPAVPGMSPADGSIAGRRELLGTPYSYLEFSIREQLVRLLGPGGFDPVRDIQAITVNRWGHGYAPEYATPWNLDFYPGGPFPAETARRRWGRIAIANSDSVPAAYADAAITAAYRAVLDLRT
ncbi:NAD(P)-binding protein [Streptosporangium sp. NPDC001559]|uniref:NAD(P)/FAD-dependent oxidoreductase n=1 Tax=Streptosporangium sp. NPDC001559 TaxID=3366187 RepID=UPI0036F12682